MKITVLGCGTSAGVPQIGCRCAVCTSKDPRNKRRRCSVYIEVDDMRILVDTSPDLRQQCLEAGISEVDALLYTHAHADHLHGIDDIRQINNVMMAPIQAWADKSVFERIRERFGYAMQGGQGTSTFGFWRPEISPNVIDGPFEVEHVRVNAFRQQHGRGFSWGFRIGKFAYSTDTNGLDERAFDALRGVEVWIVDALRDRPHPSHAHLSQTLEWIARVKPKRAFLTHMNHEVDYAGWMAKLPAGVAPAHDGLVLET